MKRLGLAFSIGITITLGLFYFMSALISMGKDYQKNADVENVIDFVRIKPRDTLDIRNRKMPKKPPEPKKPPQINRIKIAKADTPKTPQMNLNIPKLNLPVSLGKGPFLGQAGAGSNDAATMPLVRIEPQYPRKAAMTGTEGWVILKFDITPAGTVDNVKILQSQPRRVFDSAARRALLKWKYKPKFMGGKPVSQSDNKVKIDFRLEG